MWVSSVQLPRPTVRVRTLTSLTNSSGAPKRSPQAWARRAARVRSA